MQESLIKQSGFSLLEVLISMVIIAVGLLGLSGLQIASLKGTTNAHSRNIATLLTMELSERMRANPKDVKKDEAFYDNDVDCANDETVCEGSKYCTSQETARYDVQQVMCGILRYDDVREGGAANLLPAGTLQVSCVDGCSVNDVNTTTYNVTIGWNESLLHKDDQGNADTLRSSKTQSITTRIIP